MVKEKMSCKPSNMGRIEAGRQWATAVSASRWRLTPPASRNRNRFVTGD
jgi:hypothetical protein